MSSIGHVSDAVSRDKQNRTARQDRHNRVSRLRELYVGGYHNEHLTLPTYSPEQLAEIKKCIIDVAHKERRKAFMIAGIMALLMIAVFAVVFYSLN